MHNNYDDEREIDLLDLLRVWISHWKSLLVVFVAAIVIGGALLLISGKINDATYSAETVESVEETQEVKDSASGKPTTLAAVEEKYGVDFSDASSLSDKDLDVFFDYVMTVGGAIQVENLVDVYNVYADSYQAYQASKDDMTAAEAAETCRNLSDSYASIMSTKSSMTACQKAYFSMLIGEQVDLTNALSEVEEAEKAAAETEEAEKAAAETEEATGFSFGFKHFAILVVVAIFLHAMVICLIYILDGKIKRTDPVADMIDSDEIGRFDSAELTAAALEDIADKKDIASLGLVALDAAEAAQTLAAACTGLDTTLVTNLPTAATDMETICNMENAVILVTAEKTKLEDLRKMAYTLRLHQVNVLGVIIN